MLLRASLSLTFLFFQFLYERIDACFVYLVLYASSFFLGVMMLIIFCFFALYCIIVHFPHVIYLHIILEYDISSYH